MLLLGMVFLITLVVVMTGLSIAGYAVTWGWLGILLAFLLMIVGFLVSWYYRSILAKPEVKKAPVAQQAYAYGGSYPPQYSAYPSYSQPSYSYPSYGYQQPTYGYPQQSYGYQQQPAYGSYPAYGYQAPRYVPPVTQPTPAGPSGAPKTCANCQRPIPVEARFCPYCRAVQGAEASSSPSAATPPATPPS